jgi:hypothetical protein
MHRRTMDKQGADVPDVHSYSDRAGGFSGSFLAEFDDLFAIEVGDVELAEPGSQQVQAEAFRTSDVLANLHHIRDMRVDQVGRLS